jgi:lipid-A-disaccharide synthase
VVIYRISRAMVLEAKILRFKVGFVSLPNILLERRVVAELIHTAASPEGLRRELDALLADGPEREAQLDAFRELDDLLGPGDALTQAARLAVGMIAGG